MWKAGVMNIKRLQVNHSSYIEGTSYLFSKQVNRCQGDGFSSVGAQTGDIKLAMAGSYLGLVVPISSIVELLILHS